MINKTGGRKKEPSVTIFSARDWLVNLDRNPDIGYNPKVTKKLSKKSKKGGK
ncbi:MAG: hypothetical protein RMI01_08790 [Thermodesulfovibrio sp.]|nr:hypothetical protein [Thermodesulfovibrio sp.]